MTYNEIVDAIKKEMDVRKVSGTQLAKKLEISQQTITEMIAGRRIKAEDFVNILNELDFLIEKKINFQLKTSKLKLTMLNLLQIQN